MNLYKKLLSLSKRGILAVPNVRNYSLFKSLILISYDISVGVSVDIYPLSLQLSTDAFHHHSTTIQNYISSHETVP